MVVQEGNRIELDTHLPSNAKTPDIDGIELKEAFNHVDDFAPKVRKPYTITKQRERWTEEEHKKFLEALKLYGRAWRKIEEHVGSKTAVQIRSHAQKFFSKVVRECNNGEANCSVKPIEIPPPRPKRKPMHPYPRKLSSQIKIGISISEQPNGALSCSEQDNQSPSSVLSTVGPDSSCNEQKHEISSEKMDLVKEYPNGSTRQSLKLFGKTFSICSGVSVSTIEVHNPKPVKARLSCENMCKDEQKEGSSSGSNSDGEEKRVVKSKGAFSSYKLNKKNYGNCRKGFVPYKRCVMEKNSTVVQPVDVLEA